MSMAQTSHGSALEKDWFWLNVREKNYGVDYKWLVKEICSASMANIVKVEVKWINKDK